MPDEDRLPAGPRREMVAAVHRLYRLAGKPAVRKISSLIKDRDDLPGTLSHEGVSAVLRGDGGVPRWANLESLVRVLAGQAIMTLNVDDEVVRVHTLWSATDEVLGFEVVEIPDRSDDKPGGAASSLLVNGADALDLVSTGAQELDDRAAARDEASPIRGIPALYYPATGELRMKVTPSHEVAWISQFDEDDRDA